MTIALALSGPAMAAGRQPFDIPPGPIGPALARFALQANRQILFTPSVVASCATRGVKGTPSVRDALRQLIGACLLRARFIGDDLVLIEPIEAGSPAPRPDPAPPAQAESEIIVTALKRETPLALTPAAINVVRGGDLLDHNATTNSDLAQLSPAMSLFNAGTGQQRLTVRGIYGTGEPTVGVYYGETPVSGPSGTTLDPGAAMPDLDLVDVDRIELIRGPQGTLYGASSMGGTLRILFNQPQLTRLGGEISAGGSVTADGRAARRGSAVLNLPVAGAPLALRLVAYDDVDGGYIDNLTLRRADRGRVERRGARAALLWQPSATVSVTATAAIQRLHSDDSAYAIRAAGPRATDQSVITPFSSEIRLANLTGSAKQGSITFLLTASHYEWKQDRNSDYNAVIAGEHDDPVACQRYVASNVGCSPAQLAAYGDYVENRLPAMLHQPLAVHGDTVELRAATPSRSRGPSATVGLFVQRRRDDTDSYAVRADPLTGRLTDPLDITGYRRLSAGLYQKAAFGELSWALPHRVLATVGLRYFDYLRTATNSVPIPNVITGTATVDPISRRTRETGTIAKLGLAWRPDGRWLLYATAAQGYRPGGVNITPGLTEDQLRYRSDSLWSYEVGAKFHPRQGSLAVDAALFHIDWSNMIYMVTSASGAFAYNTNIGSVNVDGFELSATLPLGRGRQVHGEIDGSFARLAQDQVGSSAAGRGYRGDRLPNEPGLAMGLDASQQLALSPTLDARFGLGAMFASGFGSQFNRGMSLYEWTPSRLTINAQASLIGRHGQLTLAARNLLNATAATRVQRVTDGSERIYTAGPATVSLIYRHRF